MRRHRLSVEIRRLEILRGELDAVRELAEVSFLEADDSVASELTDTFARLVRRMGRAERELVGFDERDQGDARIVVTAAGALESAADWARDLAGMYAAWAKVRGYDVETSEHGQWLFEVCAVSGTMVGTFASRSAALAALFDWLNEHWLA